ncbi:MAG: sulfotransferase [Bacteroidia bacterium]
MDTIKKNVIIGGSTKCGTTSLFRYLSGHPQICASKIKETRFFWDGDYDLPQQKINNKEVKNYLDFFFDCSEDQWKLEATPDYLYSYSSAEKIKSQFPDCRFIFILRDPEQRIISWFKYSKQLGDLPGDCTADNYMKHLLKADKKKSPQHLRALEQGRYAGYLQNYINLFGKQNILITFHKDLQNDPKLFMLNVCDFLKIEKSYYDNFDFKVFNPSLNVKNVSQFNKYRQFKKKLRSYNNRLPQSYRNFFKSIMKPLDVFYLKSKSDKWEEISLSSSNKKFLSEYYLQDHELLEKTLGKKVVW